MTEAVYPIPLRGLSCPCGEELEVVECRSGALDLVCRRRQQRSRPRALPSTRVCDRCGLIVERAIGQVGATPVRHRGCRTTAELARLTRQRSKTSQYYASHKSQWTDYADRKRARLASAAAAESIPPAGSPT